MAFTFIRPLIEAGGINVPAQKKVKPAKTPKKAAPAFDLNQPGRLRAAQVRQILGIAESTFYEGLKKGRFPAASGKDGAMVYWDTAVIREFLAGKV